MHWLWICLALFAHAPAEAVAAGAPEVRVETVKPAEDPKALAVAQDAELKARIAQLEAFYADIASFAKTPPERALKAAEVAAYDKRVSDSEKAYQELRGQAEALLLQATNPSSWLSVNRQLTLTKLDLLRTMVMNEWRYFREGRPEVIGRSISNDRLRSVLETLLVDHEFCYSVRNCAKSAKTAAAASKPNLQFMFQAVDDRQNANKTAVDEEGPAPASMRTPDPLPAQP